MKCLEWDDHYLKVNGENSGPYILVICNPPAHRQIWIILARGFKGWKTPNNIINVRCGDDVVIYD